MKARSTLSGFETYLEQYPALWRALKDFQVIYVADSKRLYQAAERRFAAFWANSKIPSPTPMRGLPNE